MERLPLTQRIRYAIIGIRGSMRVPIRTRIQVWILERLVQNPDAVDFHESGAIRVSLSDGGNVLFGLTDCGYSALAAHSDRIGTDYGTSEAQAINRQWVRDSIVVLDRPSDPEWVAVEQIGLGHLGSPARAYRWGGES